MKAAQSKGWDWKKQNYSRNKNFIYAGDALRTGIRIDWGVGVWIKSKDCFDKRDSLRIALYCLDVEGEAR